MGDRWREVVSAAVAVAAEAQRHLGRSGRAARKRRKRVHLDMGPGGCD